MMRAGLLMDARLVELVFGADEQRAVEGVIDVDFSSAVNTVAELRRPDEIELLITGWGMPALTTADFDALPCLRAIVHWGGGVPSAEEAAARGIAVSSAKVANAVPVAEFTLAMLTLAAKDVFWAARRYATQQRRIDREAEYGRTGLRGAVVGIVGASTIGRLVIRGLRSRNIEVTVYDPTLSPAEAANLDVAIVDDLVTLARQSRILSVHAPDIPVTRRMVSAEVLSALPDDATLINTARGALVDQEALVRELSSGRIRAVLDVTEPEVLPPEHPLYSLPNVFLTPHLAGSMGSELRALGAVATAEVLRFAHAEPFEHPVHP